jgi:hypothetical protein
MVAGLIALAMLAGPADVEVLRQRAVALDRARDHAGAAVAWEELAARLPLTAEPCWRAARSHWNIGRRLAPEDAAGRRRAYRLTREWAERGLAADPECGECHLYKAAGIGGEVRDRGVVAGALQVSEIAALLERGIEIMSARPDAASNSELEDLYYAAAQLYRSVPDSGVLRWTLGVPGDRARAVDYLRRATAIAGGRPDYQVELAAMLLCWGRATGDSSRQVEGFALLHGVLARDDVATPVQGNARALIDEPGTACDHPSR